MQLWNDLFKQLGTMGVAASAGLLILLELNVVRGDGSFFAGILCLVVGSLAAIAGAVKTLEVVDDDARTTKSLNYFLLVTFCLLGTGAGTLGAVLTLK